MGRMGGGKREREGGGEGERMSNQSHRKQASFVQIIACTTAVMKHYHNILVYRNNTEPCTNQQLNHCYPVGEHVYTCTV